MVEKAGNSSISKSFSSAKLLKERIEYHLKNTMGLGLKGVLSVEDAIKRNLHMQIFKALSLTLRENVMTHWIATNQEYKKRGVKKLFYFSAEYLTGRFAGNNLINLNEYERVRELLHSIGLNLNELEDYESDAGLGNGGLGRLAACFLDSLAALELPGHGYGLRYDYGIFRQEILDGYQVEHPDQWLQHGNPWEVQHEEEYIIVKFGGSVHRSPNSTNREKTALKGYEAVSVVPYDTPVIGFNNGTVNTLRLWSTSVPDYEQFDIHAFDKGDYESALKDVLSHDNLTMVSILYPNDNHDSGKRLRLKQQYVLVSASIQDIIRSYKAENSSMLSFYEKVAIQINDTHPSMVIAELMRLLVDEEGISWNEAWNITVNTCAYTNHTVLSEALEQWDAYMMKELLPRVYEIIEIINHDFCIDVISKYHGTMQQVREMSILENGKVRMANLAIVGSHSVNGVAELHTTILKEQVLKDFYSIFPKKFNNKTNGVTPRRWLLKPNPDLANFITEHIGDKWLKNLSELKKLEAFVEDRDFLIRIMEIKHNNKVKLSSYIHQKNPVKDMRGAIVERINVDPTSIFDIQAKRLHEYKRQLLNGIHILMLYNELKNDRSKTIVPRTFLFAAKSAPGYSMAKSIIKFINILAKVINSDRDIKEMIKIVYLENYNVSLAEKLLVAGDLSEQISTAGLEASGTGNMKLAMNGALTIGTMDGANVEMSQEIGEENMFIFGLRANEVKELKERGYDPKTIIRSEPAIERLLNQLWSDELTNIPQERQILGDIAKALMHEDRFLILKDLMSYKKAQERVSELYVDKISWAKKVVLNIARMGKFSSDRSILEYNRDIWGLKHTPVPKS